MPPDSHDPQAATHDAAQQLLATFRTVAATMPWYRVLLDEAGVKPADIRTTADLTHLPRLTKQATFDRFGVRALAATTPAAALASVLTSSGHGGRFSFGLITRDMDAAGAEAIDGALDEAFEVRSRPTLAINALPMGVTFGSSVMTVATTSVREDMAAALLDAFGAEFAQVLVVADPLFLKRLLDYTRERGFDWRRHRTQVVVGEEVFGEHFRAYAARRIGLTPDREDGTWLMSSMGVGELGLHLLYETRATAALRRLLAADRRFAHDVLGVHGTRHGVPMCFTWEPRRIHVEVVDPDEHGFGRLLVSMLDPGLPIPLLRYETGDVARLVDAASVRDRLEQRHASLPGPLPDRLVLLCGRVREVLPDGTHLTVYKDAVYADERVADVLTGAVRVTFDTAGPTMHVQLARGVAGDATVAPRLHEVLRASAAAVPIRVWPYERFPFGMSLDYERKFVGYEPPA